jgi:hypothetical protein
MYAAAQTASEDLSILECELGKKSLLFPAERPSATVIENAKG